MIQVPDIFQPAKPNPGLVAIESARAREETLSSMMKHVRNQADMMNRIRWEERTERAEGSYGAGDNRHVLTTTRAQNLRGGQGVRESLTEYAESPETKFVRCALSEVVNEIKSEDTQKRELMDLRRERARIRRLEAGEQARAAQAEAEKERAHRRSYTVKSMDALGGGARPGCTRGANTVDKQPSNTPTNAEHFLTLASAKLSE
jgi:hypothetical protein